MLVIWVDVANLDLIEVVSVSVPPRCGREAAS